MIDLTMMLDNKTPVFNAPWHPLYEIKKLGSHEKEGRETSRLTLGTHTGTHIDAPRHFIKNGDFIENIELEKICGKTIILDFSQMPDKSEITLELLKEKLQGRDFERLLFRFDWDVRALNNHSKYFKDHPYISKKCCEWLVEKKCKLVGFDTPQPDNPENGSGSEEDSPNHKILLANNIYIVEYLINLRYIKEDSFYLIVAPLKVKQGDGAPARCFAINKEKIYE